MHSQLEPESNPLEERAAQALLEGYLDRLCAPLEAAESGEDAPAIRMEMRSHIEALAATHQELGSRPMEAMREALRQFGAPAQIGRQIRREREGVEQRMRRLTWGTFATLLGFAFGAIGGRAVALAFGWLFGDKLGADDPSTSVTMGMCLGLISG